MIADERGGDRDLMVGVANVEFCEEEYEGKLDMFVP